MQQQQTIERKVFRSRSNIGKLLPGIARSRLFPDRLRDRICEKLVKDGVLAPQTGVCPVCRRMAPLDCYTIPAMTCGRAECEDRMMERSSRAWNRIVKKQIRSRGEPKSLESISVSKDDDPPF